MTGTGDRAGNKAGVGSAPWRFLSDGVDRVKLCVCVTAGFSTSGVYLAHLCHQVFIDQTDERMSQMQMNM